jgi:hypothetical protein
MTEALHSKQFRQKCNFVITDLIKKTVQNTQHFNTVQNMLHTLTSISYGHQDTDRFLDTTELKWTLITNTSS